MENADDVRLAQLAENFRFYSDLRFKQLTLFMGAMIAAGAGVSQFPQSRWWVALAAMSFTGVTWVMEIRSTLFGVRIFEAAPQVLPLPSAMFPWLNQTLVVLLLHAGSYVFWLWCIRAWCVSCVSFWPGFIVGAFLFVFSIANYYPLAKKYAFKPKETVPPSDPVNTPRL